MNLRNKLRKFFTLSRRHEAGFTLIELIVVIAILGILGGVAVPVYSGYMKKVNVAADEALISDVEKALYLAIYKDFEHEFASGVAIVLSVNGEPVVKSTADDVDAKAADEKFAKDAMTAAFGSDWEDILRLSYEGWTKGNAANIVQNYKTSSYAGNEDVLVEQVGELTGAMAAFFSSGNRNIPSALTDYIEANGEDVNDPTVLANSVLVVLGDSISAAEDENRTNISSALSNIAYNYYYGSQSGSIGDTTAALQKEYAAIYGVSEDDNMVTLATAATLYAYAEAYSQYAYDYNGYSGGLDTLHGITFDPTADGSATLAQVVNAFETIVTDAANSGTAASAAAQEYFFSDTGTQNKTDATAFLSMMDAISDSSDVLSSDLANPNFYTDATIANLLNGYITVGNLNITDGQVAVIINPNKSVVSFLGSIGK